MQPADVNNFSELEKLAQELCKQDNHIDGIIVLSLQDMDTNPIPLAVSDPTKIEGVDMPALGTNIAKILDSAQETIISSDFHPGDVVSLVYEFEKVAFALYSISIMEGKVKDGVYLVLANVSDKNLGAFNMNRNKVRAQMAVGILRSGNFFYS